MRRARAAWETLPAGEVAFVGHCRTTERVLQPLDCALVASATADVGTVLAVVLHERLQLGTAHIQRARKVKRNIGRMVSPRLAVFVGLVAEKLPLIGAFFRHFNRGFSHIRHR